MGSLAGIALVGLLLASMMAEPNMMDASVKVEELCLIAEVCAIDGGSPPIESHGLRGRPF